MTLKYKPSDVTAADADANASEAIGIMMGATMTRRGHIGAEAQKFADELAEGVVNTLTVGTGKTEREKQLMQAILLQAGHQLQVAALNMTLEGQESVSIGDLAAAHIGVARIFIQHELLEAVNKEDFLNSLTTAQQNDLREAITTIMQTTIEPHVHAAEMKFHCHCCVDEHPEDADSPLMAKLRAGRAHEASASTGRMLNPDELAEVRAVAAARGIDIPENADKVGVLSFKTMPTRAELIAAIAKATGDDPAVIEKSLPADLSVEDVFRNGHLSHKSGQTVH